MRSLFLAAMLFFVPVQAQAQTSPLNAGFVASIWYDQTTFVAPNDIAITTGFYNASQKTITGKAVFYIEQEKIAAIALSSAPGALVQTSTLWQSTPGEKNIRIVFEGEDVVVERPEVQAAITVKKPVQPTTPQTLIDSAAAIPGVQTVLASPIVQNATDAVTAITEKVNEYTNDLATSLSEKKTSGQVLGAATESEKEEKGAIESTVKKVKDTSIDTLSWVVRNWQWAGLGLLFLILFLLRRSR